MSKSSPSHTDFDGHIDPDTLAAFAENALNEGDTTHLFTHLSVCERCRDLLSVHAQLRGFHWNLGGVRRQTPTWSTAAFVRAAGLGFAVLILGLMMLPAYHPMRHSVHPHQSVDQVRTEHQSASEASQIAETRRAPKQSLPFGKRHSLPAATIRKQADSYHRRFAGQLNSPVTLWRLANFQNFKSHFNPGFLQDPAKLPGPLASARLENQMSFITASSDLQAIKAEEKRAPMGSRIAVQTTLGERRIYLNVFGNELATAQ